LDSLVMRGTFVPSANPKGVPNATILSQKRPLASLIYRCIPPYGK
jgi:hypothetical protein